MTPGRAVDHLDHMVEAVASALAYVSGMDKASFLADKRTQQAVVWNFVVLGEAAAQLARDAPKVVNAAPDIPWKSIRGMRNRIAHGYLDIDLGVVWTSIESDLPRLLQQLRDLRSRIGAD